MEKRKLAARPEKIRSGNHQPWERNRRQKTSFAGKEAFSKTGLQKSWSPSKHPPIKNTMARKHGATSKNLECYCQGVHDFQAEKESAPEEGRAKSAEEKKIRNYE